MHPVASAVLALKMNSKYQKILTTRKVETQIVDWIVERVDLFLQHDTKNTELVTSPEFELGTTIKKTSKWTLSFSVADAKLGVYLNLRSVQPTIPPSTEGLTLSLQPPETASINVVSNYTLQVGKPSEDFLPLVFHKNNRVFTSHEGFGTPSMTSIKDLFARKHEFFHNNSLQIRLLITIISDAVGMLISGPAESVASKSISRPKTPIATTDVRKAATLFWHQNFERLYNNKSFADLVIHCGAQTFYCHTLVLQAQATDLAKLKNTIRNNCLTKLQDVPLKHVELNLVHVQDPQSLEALLKYLYTGELKAILSVLNTAVSLDAVNSVFIAADALGIAQLKMIVLDNLTEVLDDRSAAVAFSLLCKNNTNNDMIATQVLTYCRRNLETLLKLPVFKEAALAFPSFLLSTTIDDAAVDINLNNFSA